MSIHFDSAVPQFSVTDVVRTAKYYKHTFGFQITGYWDGERVHQDDDAPAVFAIVQRGQVRLHFSRAKGSSVRTDGAAERYDVYLHVAGIDELVHELRDRGAEILDGPVDRVYGQRELVVRDCNGFVLAFGDNASNKEVASTLIPTVRCNRIHESVRFYTEVLDFSVAEPKADLADPGFVTLER